MIGLFEKTSCSFFNTVLPNLTQVINHQKINDPKFSLWDIYCDICFKLLSIEDQTTSSAVETPREQDLLQTIFWKNYSIFLQRLIIDLIKLLDDKNPYAHNVYEKLLNTENFFINVNNKTNIFIDDNLETVLTSMSNQKISIFNSKALFDKLISVVLNRFSLDTFIEFISHKNKLGMSSLQLVIQSKNREFLAVILKNIKLIAAQKSESEIYDLFFKDYYDCSMNNTVSLINTIILSNDELIFSDIINAVEQIYGIKNSFFREFISNKNLSSFPLLLTSLLWQKNNFKLLIEKLEVAYENEPIELMNCFSQQKIFEKKIIPELVSLQHLLIKMNNRSNNINMLTELLQYPDSKSYENLLDLNRAKIECTELSQLLLNTLLQVFKNDTDKIFEYYTTHNSRGETLFHLLDNNDIIDNNVINITDNLKCVFQEAPSLFIKVINFRSYQGLTPFLMASLDKNQVTLAKFFVDNYEIDQTARPYSSLLLVDEENSKNPNAIYFVNMNYLREYAVTYGNIGTLQQLKKENIFSFWSFIFKHDKARALNARVQKIKYENPDLLQLNQEDKEQIDIYQNAITSLDSYCNVNEIPLSSYYKGYITDSIEVINSTLVELFIHQGYDYVLLHKTKIDILLIGRTRVNYYFFSHSLFSPLKVFSFTMFDDPSYIALWIKKYFFIEHFDGQGCAFYPFKLNISSNTSEFFTPNFNESVEHYRDKLNQLDLKIIMTDEMLLEQKILGLKIKNIQQFFFLDNEFISLEKFKDNDNFFQRYVERLSFRVEMMEVNFFHLSDSEKLSLQLILKNYSTISYEKHDKFFKAIDENIKDYFELQKLFLKFYAELILDKMREETFRVKDWIPEDLYQISLLSYEKSIDNLESDFIDELIKIHGKKTVLHFLFQEKIQPLIRNLKARKTRSIYEKMEKIFFPTLSSLPYAIKAIATTVTHSASTAVNDFLTAVAPWIDLVTPVLIDKISQNLPPQTVLLLKSLEERCPNCMAGLSKIAKNFPMFSMVIITKSLVDLLGSCDLNKSYSAKYCINSLSNIIMSYFLAGVDTLIPITTKEEFRVSALVLITLISHSFSIETYHQYKKIEDEFNLSGLGIFQKGYIALNTALGSLSTDNFNYATIGIQSKDLVFATLEKYLDEHARDYKLDYTYAALVIPHIDDTNEFTISESGRRFPLFKIQQLSNFEFIFTKNTTFCHDPSGIQITPDHAVKFSQEYNLGIGTFINSLETAEKKCSKGKHITAPYIAKADGKSKAIILTNTLPESERKDLRLSSVNFLFALIDPATINNYTWTFNEDYLISPKKELFGFIIKRIIPLKERKILNIARIKITGQGLTRPDVVSNTYSINFGIHSSSIGKNSKIIIEPSEDTPILQLFAFHLTLQSDLFYFDGDTLTNKKGFEIIKLGHLKNVRLQFANQFYTTENLTVSIPCKTSFICNGGLANETYPFKLARSSCDYEQYKTIMYFELMPNTQFTYNDTLHIKVGSFDMGGVYKENKFMGSFYKEGILTVKFHKIEEFKLSKNVYFNQINVMPTEDYLHLQFNLENTTALVYLSLNENAQGYFDHYSQLIEGYWSEELNHKKSYLEISKRKGQIWRTKYLGTLPGAEYSQTLEFNVKDMNKNNNYDEIVIIKPIFSIHYYFPKKNNFVLTGIFDEYALYNNKVLLTDSENNNSTAIIFPLSGINLVIINNVSYFINFPTNRLLAVKILGTLTQPLLAPLRIADNFKNYSLVTPKNKFPAKLIKYLQFDDELVSIRYFNYYQFMTSIEEEDSFIGFASKLTQEESVNEDKATNYWWWLGSGISLLAVAVSGLCYRYFFRQQQAIHATYVAMFFSAGFSWLPSNAQSKIAQSAKLETSTKRYPQNQETRSTSSAKQEIENKFILPPTTEFVSSKNDEIRINDSKDISSGVLLSQWILGYLFGRRSISKRMNKAANCLTNPVEDSNFLDCLEQKIAHAIDAVNDIKASKYTSLCFSDNGGTIPMEYNSPKSNNASFFRTSNQNPTKSFGIGRVTQQLN